MLMTLLGAVCHGAQLGRSAGWKVVEQLDALDGALPKSCMECVLP